MNMASFGQLTIEVSPDPDNPGILHVDIAAQLRKDALHMKTQKDETIDQFASRIRSMLRALSNGELRSPAEVEVAKEKPKPKTWEEQKKAMKPMEVKA